MRLLSSGDTNTKMKKSNGRGYLLFGLSLAPASESGYNLCAGSTASCRAGCVLWWAGRSKMPSVRRARIRKARRLFEHRRAFVDELTADASLAVRQAKRKDLECVIRLNVASDQVWEVIAPELFNRERFPVQWYDYTKLWRRRPPANYHLTYSFSEATTTDDALVKLRAGSNVAIVFDTIYNPSHGNVGALPERWNRFKVVDGDYAHGDLRLPDLDGRGVVIGLRGKGGIAKVSDMIRGGFALPVPDGVAARYGIDAARTTSGQWIRDLSAVPMTISA